MALIREKKNTVPFNQTIDNEVYKQFYSLCKSKGLTVQDRIRQLVAEDLQQNKFFNQ